MSGWTPEREALLARLWETHSAAKIARRLGGVTRNAVLGKAYRMGLPAKGGPPPPHHPDDLRAMRAARKRRGPSPPRQIGGGA